MKRLIVILALCTAACGGEPDYLPIAELMNPDTCKDCHPVHYEEWKSSMHAYAGIDPVFLAMNRRGQRETNGALGDFCVKCHAPMAVRTGATTDGLNLADVDPKLKGVTCFFCHTAESVEGTHNNPVVLSGDGVLRAAVRDPVENGKHATGYSPLLDRTQPESTTLCGACHDIVTDAGVHLERTYEEWQASLFAHDNPTQHRNCGQCHMSGDRDGVIADFEGVPLRKLHEHTFPGIDVALTDWPGKDLQLDGITRDLEGAIAPKLCVGPNQGGGGVAITYTLDNLRGGHMWPSGATQDRRAWAEIVAVTGGEVVYQTGVVDDGQPVAEAAAADPELWQIRDFATDESGDPAHMFWEVATIDSQLLPPAVTNDPTDIAFYHSVEKTFEFLGAQPDTVTAKVHIRPIGLDVIDDLIDSGDLDPAVRDEISTFTLEGTVLTWKAEYGPGCIRR
ncbi:MAG TPA: multiheme c-type cytochrome [Kofleriaceae bacterium]|nr:multiheme c-type cytochrome [Kofleriaceae bacterium]